MSTVNISSSRVSSGWDSQGYAIETLSLSSTLESYLRSQGSTKWVVPSVNTSTANVSNVDNKEHTPKRTTQSVTNRIEIDVSIKGDEPNLPEISSYDWVSHDVREHNSQYQWEKELVDLAKQFYVLGDNIDDLSSILGCEKGTNEYVTIEEIQS